MADAADEETSPRGPVGGQRLDKWLWFARVVKSRTMAAGLVTSGKVRVNRQKVDKPAQGLRLGDVVTVSVGRKVRVLRVVAPGVRRGPAKEAQELFEELTPAAPSPIAGAESPVRDAHPPHLEVSAERAVGAGRPTKRDRRMIDRLRNR